MRFVYRPNHPAANENGMIPTDMAGYEPKPWSTAIISDNMEPLKHHGTGRIIDSKSKFRAETRAIGGIELGNEPIKPRQPIKLNKRQRREDIRKALYELRQGIKSGNY
jgi:hypothetical protein